MDIYFEGAEQILDVRKKVEQFFCERIVIAFLDRYPSPDQQSPPPVERGISQKDKRSAELCRHEKKEFDLRDISSM